MAVTDGASVTETPRLKRGSMWYASAPSNGPIRGHSTLTPMLGVGAILSACGALLSTRSERLRARWGYEAGSPVRKGGVAHFFLSRIAHISEEFKNKGYAFTTLLKYKQKYEDAKFEFTNSIPRSSVKQILGVVKLSNLGDLVEEDDHYVLEDIAIVYEDEKKQIRITIPIPWMDETKILKNFKKIVISNKTKMLKNVILEAIMKKKKDNFIAREFYYYHNVAYPPDGKIIYYTDEVKVNDNMLPDKGFFYANDNVYTNDQDILNSAAKYIVELNGIKVNNLKELIQIFMKFKDKLYITGDTLASFKYNEVVSLAETCATPLYLDYIVIYTNDFKAEIDCGLKLKKGVIMFSYEWIAASPDVWSALSTP